MKGMSSNHCPPRPQILGQWYNFACPLSAPTLRWFQISLKQNSRNKKIPPDYSVSLFHVRTIGAGAQNQTNRSVRIIVATSNKRAGRVVDDGHHLHIGHPNVCQGLVQHSHHVFADHSRTIKTLCPAGGKVMFDKQPWNQGKMLFTGGRGGMEWWILQRKSHLTKRPTSSPCCVIGNEKVNPRLNSSVFESFWTLRKSRMHSARKWKRFSPGPSLKCSATV